jgi:gliding motility-associated protein GldC
MMQSKITIDVTLDDTRVPESISWHATDNVAGSAQKAKGMILSFWDGTEKTALRVDLWTKEMMVDEMADFFYQTIMTMADTYDRATHQHELVNEMKTFAKGFYEKFQASQSENKL